MTLVPESLACLVIFVGLAFAAGCQVQESAPPGPPAPLVAPPPAPVPDKAAVVQAGNRFAFDLYTQLRGRPGNLVFSPYSISTALTMTYAGARGDTAREMAAVLRLPPDRLSPPDWIHAASARVLYDLRSAGRAEGCELSIANALWGQKGYGFLPDFLALLDKSYGAGLMEVDFKNDAEGARKAINAWAEKETRNKIKDIVDAGALDSLTRLVLANAVYFKGRWAHPFKKSDTHDDSFYVTPDKPIVVPMMHQDEERFAYLKGDTFRALEMPYRREALSMVLLLPERKDGLAEFEKGLSAEKLAEWLPKLAKCELPVAVPKFKMTVECLLARMLSAMGMPLAFDSSKADFSGMGGGKEPLFIAEVIHKAFVDVNEEGTEAAAVTAMPAKGAEKMPDAPFFIADHPFVFLICDTRSGAILFMGRVVNPAE